MKSTVLPSALLIALFSFVGQNLVAQELSGRCQKMVDAETYGAAHYKMIDKFEAELFKDGKVKDGMADCHAALLKHTDPDTLLMKRLNAGQVLIKGEDLTEISKAFIAEVMTWEEEEDMPSRLLGNNLEDWWVKQNKSFAGAGDLKRYGVEVGKDGDAMNMAVITIQLTAGTKFDDEYVSALQKGYFEAMKSQPQSSMQTFSDAHPSGLDASSLYSGRVFAHTYAVDGGLWLDLGYVSASAE